MKLFKNYKTEGFFDEAVAEAPDDFRKGYRRTAEYFSEMTPHRMRTSLRSLERTFLHQGVTFTVYDDGQGTERIFPFDPFPRIIPADEWSEIDEGLQQRIKALNMFLKDIYSDQKIIKDGKFPSELVETSVHYQKDLIGLELPHDTYIHICGTDLIRDGDGTYRVLEDNGRCPSGVSYMMENRLAMKRTFPDLYKTLQVKSVSNYPRALLKMLKSVSHRDLVNPVCVVLTPGQYNSAYFEHTFLARQMGIEIVEGRDLTVENDCVFMHTTKGLVQVDVIYRRIDDNFLDPNFINPDTMIGVPGLMKAYQAGNVMLVNAPGTGVADDKATYSYVPAMIKYYLSEDPILSNVDTYLGSRKDDLKYMLENIDKIVIKAVDEAGGYGMLIGPASTKKEQDEFKEKIKSNPRGFIGQPVINLSRHPTFCNGKVEGRHIDLRPYILTGKETVVTPGGLTRVALKRGSLVVNSSQGGGSKDTWVLSEDSPEKDESPPEQE